MSQDRKFIATVVENLPEISSEIKQGWIENPNGLKKFLAGLSPEASSKKVSLGRIIHVDRSVKPTYPAWMKKVLHPELEATNPAEYDISKVELWLHDGQKKGNHVEGNKIYTHLKETDILKSCLNLRDLEEIQKKGVAFFRKYFKDKALFGWKSVVRHVDGNLSVPYLFASDDRVMVHWHWLGGDWYGNNPAGRFAS